MGKFYHRECFVCDFCRQDFQGSFVTKYDKPLCRQCDLKLYGMIIFKLFSGPKVG